LKRYNILQRHDLLLPLLPPLVRELFIKLLVHILLLPLLHHLINYIYITSLRVLTLLFIEVLVVVPQFRELIILVLVYIHTALLLGFLGFTDGLFFESLCLHYFKF
jgi:hypothetical protein